MPQFQLILIYTIQWKSQSSGESLYCIHCIVQIRRSVRIETKTNQTTHHSSIKSESERDMESTEEVLTLPDLYQIMCDSDDSCLPNVFCGTSSLSETLGEATSFGSEFRTQIEYGDKFVPQPSLHLPSMPVKRSRMTYQNVHSSRCQVEGCNLDLELAKDYHRRHRICESHSKSPKVIVAGMELRFCQQCSKFHGLSEFDDNKRSCRRRLSDHNARRRRVQPNSAQLASAGQPSAKHNQRQQNIILNGIPISLPKSTWEYANTSPMSRQVAGNSLIRPSNPPTNPVPGPTSNPWVHVEDGHSFVTTPDAANSAHSLLSSSSSSYSWWMDEGALNEHGHTN